MHEIQVDKTVLGFSKSECMRAVDSFHLVLVHKLINVLSCSSVPAVRPLFFNWSTRLEAARFEFDYTRKSRATTPATIQFSISSDRANT